MAPLIHLNELRALWAAAAWEAEEIRALQPGFSSRVWLATHPLTDQHVHAKLVKSLEALGL
ncbi:MAG: hypothetical protein ACXW2I_12210 [Burkholderiales bacterium]